MTRIKITDLPQDMQISAAEMKKVFGGIIIIGGKDSLLNTGLDARLMKLDDTLRMPGDDITRNKMHKLW